MKKPQVVRFAFGLAVVLLALMLVTSATSAGGVSDRYENPDTSVEPRENTTVITTSPRKSSDASIVALAPNGSVSYYNETYDYYFDVDPLENATATVEYVAVERFNENCAPESKVQRGGACSRNVVERVNLTTGETTRLYEHATRPVGVGGWHDVDRINESHLLVAGSTNDRVFVVNTTADVIEWQWEAQSDFPLENGGRFPADWAHINDVNLLDDGRIMVSMRNQDQVVFLDPGEGTMSAWTLGADDRREVLYEQHNPDYIPESRGGPAVLVADSENNRVVEYQRTDSGTWERTWTWRDENLRWGRDADRLPNGHTLVTDSNGNRVLEVAENGSVVWEVPVDTPYEAERLETGDESTGGESARRLGLDSRTASGTDASTERSGVSGLVRAIDAVVGSLPPVLANGLLFILPPWFDYVHLVALMSLVLILLVWVALEFRWSAYTLKSPIKKG